MCTYDKHAQIVSLPFSCTETRTQRTQCSSEPAFLLVSIKRAFWFSQTCALRLSHMPSVAIKRMIGFRCILTVICCYITDTAPLMLSSLLVLNEMSSSLSDKPLICLSVCLSQMKPLIPVCACQKNTLSVCLCVDRLLSQEFDLN